MYDKLINKAYNRQRPTPCEDHHIIPAAYWPDGRANPLANVPENMVALTLEEHFVAHWLLRRINNDRICNAAFFMMGNTLQRKSSGAYAAARLNVKMELHNRHGWVDNRLINDETSEIVEISSTRDFIKEQKLESKSKTKRIDIDTIHGNVANVLNGSSPSIFGWRLLPEFRSKSKFVPCWMTHIDTKQTKFMNTAEDVAKAAKKPSGGAITKVSMGDRTSIYRWRLATESEIKNETSL